MGCFPELLHYVASFLPLKSIFLLLKVKKRSDIRNIIVVMPPYRMEKAP
jgi:hypothetical protein